MALVEAARFHTLSEAQVAASLLRSAGIAPAIADAHYGSVFWMEQSALGGYRLTVAEEELADTLALLQAPAPEPLDEDFEPMSGGQRLLAGALGLAIPAAGWLATGRRTGPSLGEALVGTALAVGLLVGAGGLGVLVLTLIHQLLTNPP